MPELFAPIDLAEMNFNYWNLQDFQSVMDGHTRVSITTRVDDESVIHLTMSCLYASNNLSFNVRLKPLERSFARQFLLRPADDVDKRILAINLRLPLAQHVQV